MGNMHLVTGYAGKQHVTAPDHGALNSAIFGTGEYVLGKGNKLSASVISNNQIRVMDGEIMMQGRHIRLDEGRYVDLPIENGSQDTYRNDLIVARYTKNTNTGVEDCDLVVIKGTAVTSSPSDPEYTSGNILENHDVQNDMPLYRVPLIGLNVQELVCLFETRSETLADFGEKQDKTNNLNAETTIADDDCFPFYDSSATSNRKILWSNIVAKIRTALFGDSNGILKADGSGKISAVTMDNTPTENSTNAVTSGGVKSYVDAKSSVSFQVTLPASGWSNNYQTANTLPHNVAGSNLIITPAPESFVAWAESMVRCTGQWATDLGFTCEEVPTADLVANILIVG